MPYFVMVTYTQSSHSKHSKHWLTIDKIDFNFEYFLNNFFDPQSKNFKGQTS